MCNSDICRLMTVYSCIAKLTVVNTTYFTPQSGIWGVISQVMRLYFHKPKASENIAYT